MLDERLSKPAAICAVTAAFTAHVASLRASSISVIGN